MPGMRPASVYPAAMVVEALFHLAAALLILSGGAKLGDPAPTQGALRSARLPAGRPAVWLLALAEIGAGVAGLLYGGAAALGVGAIYLGFAAFVGLALLRRIPLQSCGCFGQEDTPPTRLHLMVNLAAGLAGLSVAAGGGGSLLETLRSQMWGGVLYMGFLTVGVAALILMLTSLARLQAGRR